MIWHIYSDYFRESIRTNKYFRYLTWYVWTIFLFLLLVAIGLYFCYIIFDQISFLWIMSVFSMSAGLYLGNELSKIIKARVGSHEDIYNRNYNILKDILIRKNLYSKGQTELILKQIEEELPELKISEKMLKPIYTITTILLIPIITLLIKWILDKLPESINIVFQIITLIIMIFGLYYMIKPFLEDLLDKEFKKMKKLKKMIQDIIIIDFSI